MQPPQLSAPERGSVAGQYAAVAFGPTDLVRGGFALPSPFRAPAERGAMGVDPFPVYAPEAGLTEWGLGWQVHGVALERWRPVGELDYATDELTGPWGQMARGSDGAWYSRGMQHLVRLDAIDSGFVATTQDGALWTFDALVANVRGTYAWYLTSVVTPTGRRTKLAWAPNASGRLFLTQVSYGGTGSNFQHEIEFEYDALSQSLADYRSGAPLVLDRRVRTVIMKSLVAGAMTERWRYALTYKAEGFGPAFFLTGVQRTFASGSSEPPVTYDYATASERFTNVTFRAIPKADDLVTRYGATLFQPNRSVVVDIDQDGRPDLEYAVDHTLLRQQDKGFSLESLDAAPAGAPVVCRSPVSVSNAPRTLAQMSALDSSFQVVALLAGTANSTLTLCNRAGQTLYTQSLETGWKLGSKVRLVDLNRDRQPDLIRTTYGAYRVLPNTSGAAGFSFGAGISGSLTPAITPTATWVLDMNGDGNPDLVERYASGLVVWNGKGHYQFDVQGKVIQFYSLSGVLVGNLSQYEMTFVDVNKDGLTDVVLVMGGAAYMFMNTGTRLRQVELPGLSFARSSSSKVVLMDLAGTGDTELSLVQGGHAYSMALASAETSLLRSADDGKGNVLTFTYGRGPAVPGTVQRQAVLETLTVQTTGVDSVTYQYGYSGPTLHTQGKFLVGFGTVTRQGAALGWTGNFLNGDAYSGVPSSSLRHDDNAPLADQFERRMYEDAFYKGNQGLPWKRLKSVVVGLQSVDGAQTAAERTEYVKYEAEVCPQEVHQCEDLLDIPCDSRAGENPSGARDMLVTVSSRAAISGFGSALHCLPGQIDTYGQHRDSALDFGYTAFIARNAAGQLTELQSRSASGALTLQTVTYDENFNVKTVSSPGRGTATFLYDPLTTLLDEIDGPDGVVTKVTDREPLIDRPRTIEVNRGGTPFQQYYRFDGLERLARRWNNLGSASELDPNELLTYRYAAGNMPATIHSSLLVDANAGATRNAVDYLTAGGEPIGTAAAIPEGWAFGSITERIRATRSQNAYLRRSISTAADPLALDYAALLTSTTGVGQLRSTAEGAEASRTTVLHAGVERQLVTTWTVSGGQVLESTVENDAFSVQRRLDGWKRVVEYQDEAGVTYGFTYDALGRVRRVDLPNGRRHTQSFDEHGRVALVSRDDIASVQSEYDATIGLLKRKTYFSPDGAGQREVGYAYDAIGRKTLETYADLASGQTRTYEYYYDGATPTALTARDDLGQLSAVTGEGYSKVFKHRPDGLLASRTTAVAGFPAIKLDLTYYEDGSPHTQKIMQLDESGNPLSSSERVLGVDGYGRLKEVTLNGSALVTTTYDGNGLLSGGNLANGDWLTFTHDPTTRRLIGSTQASASYVISTLQEMNSRGLVKSETTTTGATTLQRTFVYSPTGQRFLASATDAHNSYAYGFDGFGLPTFATTNGATREFFETRTYLTAGQVVYGFDSLHRTVSRSDASAPAQGLVLTYGPDGQVATATKGGVTYQFRYDEDGQRLVKLTESIPTVAYLPEGYLDSTGLTERFALGGRTVGIIKNGVYTTIATDLRGSVLAETTGVARISSPFGQRDVHPAVAAAIEYVEKGYDADLGWVRMGVRDYDPMIGRFTTPDPLFLENLERCPQSPVECNLFAYAAANPLSFSDPSGKTLRDLISGIGRGVGEGMTFPTAPMEYGNRDYANGRAFGMRMGAALDVVLGGTAAGGGLVTGPGEALLAPVGAVLIAKGAVSYSLADQVRPAPNSFAMASSETGGSGESGGTTGSTVAESAGAVPGRVASRINISNEGMKHVLSTHLNPARIFNKSQFAISEAELRELLSAKSTVEAPVRALETGNFARTITVDNRVIGTLADKLGGGRTNTFSVITDRFGNLETAFPGALP